MGQYYKYVNLDKREYLNPARFARCNLKAGEWIWDGMMPRALAVLLIDGDGRGGGDLNIIEHAPDIIGRWAGDRIVISGDYADKGKFIDSEHPPVEEIFDGFNDFTESEKEYYKTPNVYELTLHESFEDISEMVILALSFGQNGKHPFWPPGHGTCYVDKNGKHREQEGTMDYTFHPF